ncbi:phosphoribosyltransferase [bacterium (Candidatus Howlettbacteria) CG_4_10_14_0_8_um_filter_40_9]|nr:MAG: phosphoribosyltransferase [bacterium (Candidatus Howlettbacteria) CG_4_10_14_0_8_um_filter_40_9]
MIFKNRKEAGKLLAKQLSYYKETKNILVLGVPRGGVVVAKEVAEYLNAPLDIVVTRKIGHPLEPEYAIAAVDENGDVVKDAGILSEYERYIKTDAKLQRAEIKRRLKAYRGADTPSDFKDKICIIVDDGIATGLTTLSAIRFVMSKSPAKVVLAVPMILKDIIEKLKSEVDELIYLEEPVLFYAIGAFYEDFPQVEDREVVNILKHKNIF